MNSNFPFFIHFIFGDRHIFGFVIPTAHKNAQRGAKNFFLILEEK
jgi:hypothetical protein